MHIVIAGGAGFLGRALTTRLLAGGHEVTILTRSGTAGADPERPRVVLWNPDGSIDVWAHALEDADAVVNLSGAGIADGRWTPTRKALLRRSRVLATGSLMRALEATVRRPAVFVQGSAVGYYGASLSDHAVDEGAPPGTDFLAQLCVEWEAAAERAIAVGCRLVIVRSGVVLARSGGALPRMTRPFMLFGGGPVGSGRQYMSWIHLDDWIACVAWAIGNPTVVGPVNATAPEPVTNAAFARALGRALGRPSWLRTPAAALRAIVGREMADQVLLNGQRVIPTRALAGGFVFAHADVEEALEQIVRSPSGRRLL